MTESTNITADDDIVEATEGETDKTLTRRDIAAAEGAALDKRSNESIVAQRSADSEYAPSVDDHVKTFVIEPGPKPTEANGYSHEANMAAVRQYAMSQGLRPTGDVRHVSTKPHKGDAKFGWDVTYAMPAVPAERFDFAEVHVITDNEDPDGDGHVKAVKDGDNTPKAGTKAESTGDEAPTLKSTRAAIDDYAKSKGIDSTGAATKADALALLNTKPSA